MIRLMAAIKQYLIRMQEVSLALHCSWYIGQSAWVIDCDAGDAGLETRARLCHVVQAAKTVGNTGQKWFDVPHLRCG